MNSQVDLSRLEKELCEAARSGDDPRLAEALIEYFRQVRQAPYLTLLELKSVLIAYNRRGTDRRPGQRHPVSEKDEEAFLHVRDLTGISTNSIEVILRTHSRASPELIHAQQERALSRQAADIISRLNQENEWLQGQVVQVYFQKGLSIDDLKTLVGRLSEHRAPDRQKAILDEFLAPGEIAQNQGFPIAGPLPSGLSDILDRLEEAQVDQLGNDEIMALMTAAKRGRPILEHLLKESLDVLQRRFG